MPRTRRSPSKHKVSSYTRKDGTKVSNYSRGRGSKARKSKRSRVVGRGVDDDTPLGVHAFTVNFTYSKKKDDGESVIVFSDNFQDATDEAWEERIDKRMPLAVETIDPDIGAALTWMGKRVKSAIKYGTPKIVDASKLGAKFAVRATMVTGKTIGRVAKASAISGAKGAKELGRLTAFGVQKELIHSLLKLCYQKDKSKRTAARIALKRRYPEVYAAADFSSESRVRPRARVKKRTRRRRAPTRQQSHRLPQRYIMVP